MLKKCIIFILILILTIANSVNVFAYTYDSYEKFYYTGSFYGSWYLYSPFRDGSNNQLYPGVTSKYNNPRSLTSSPHGGVDFTASVGTNVYPLAAGQVIYVNSSIDPDFGKYVVVRYDVNQDGYLDSVYGRHAHLNVINVSQNQSVYASTLLGQSGSSGTTAAHLHVDMRTNNNSNNGVYRSIPFREYYSNRSNWNYGRDLDWASQHSVSGRTFYVYCYGKTDGSANITPSEVKLWVRIAGSSNSWTGYSMTNGGSYRYNVTVPTTDFPSGTQVEYFFSGKRGDVSESSYCPYGLYPAKLKAPPIPPSTSYSYDKYTLTL